MLKFYLGGLASASLITVIAPHASMIILVVACLGYAALFLEWRGGKQGRQRKARKALPKMKG